MNFIQNKSKNTTEKKRFPSNNDFMSTDEAIRNTINLFGASSKRQRKATSNECGDDNEMDEMNGTRATMASSSVRPSTMYVALTSGRGYAQAEVGLAFIDIDSPSINLNQLSDDLWFTGLITKLNILQPEKVLVPHTLYDALPETIEGKLLKYIREQFPYLNISRVPRRHFNDKDGLDLVKKVCSEKHKDIMELITTKYYALSAVSGLLKYLELSMNLNFVKNSLKLDFNAKYGHMLIDVDTTQKLELLGPAVASSTKGNRASLYDLLNNCVTRIGKRSLRAKILEPSCDTADIQSIHECIAELNRSEFFELNVQLSVILKNFYSVDRLHKLAIILFRDDSMRAAEILINQTLQLKRCLENIPLLQERLEPLSSKIFQDINECLGDVRFQKMLEHIDKVVNKDVLSYRSDSGGQLYQKISCIQNGISNLIDLSRDVYIQLTTEIREQTAALSTKCGQAFKTNYTTAKGFHLQLMVSAHTSVTDFPDELQVLELKRNTCFLTTTEITKLNIRLKSVIEEIIIQSNVVLASMLADIAQEMDVIYDLTGFIGTLDVLLSLSKVSAYDGFTRPTFADEIRIVDGVHPLLERNVERTIAVPNNVIATPDYNFFLITGPNMSGKTVYIKMIAILQIMAQLGCYIPTASAQLRITDRIFSRIGSSESIEKKSSSFVAEIKTMEYILKNVTANSLVIIDELCQTTNPREGAQLGWELCEQLICLRGIANKGQYFVSAENAENALNESFNTRSSSLKDARLEEITAPFIFLTSHYHSLTKLANSYFNAVNLCLNAEEILTNNERHLKYNYSIQEGVTNIESYGLALAKTIRFPLSIVPRAEDIYREIKNSEDGTEVNHTVHPQRHCSKFSKNLSRDFAGMQINGLSNAPTAVSFLTHSTTTSKKNKKKFSNVFNNHTFLSGTTTTSVLSSDTETECLKIDKVLYNLYSDIASAVRCKEIELTETENHNVDARQEIVNVSDECLRQFINSQPEELLQAFLKSSEFFGDDQTESSPLQSNLPSHTEIQRKQANQSSPVIRPNIDDTNNLQSNTMVFENPAATFTVGVDERTTNLSQLSFQSIQRRFTGRNPEQTLQLHTSAQEIGHCGADNLNLSEEFNETYDVANSKEKLSGFTDHQRWSFPLQSQALFEPETQPENQLEFFDNQMLTPNIPSAFNPQPSQLDNLHVSEIISDGDNSENIQRSPLWDVNLDVGNPTQLPFDENEWQNQTRHSNVTQSSLQFDWQEEGSTKKPAQKPSPSVSSYSSAIGRISLIPTNMTNLKNPFGLAGSGSSASTSNSSRKSMAVNFNLTPSENLAVPSCSYRNVEQNYNRTNPMPTSTNVPVARKSLGLKRPMPIISKHKKMEDNKILHSSWLNEFEQEAQRKCLQARISAGSEPILSKANAASDKLETEKHILTRNIESGNSNAWKQVPSNAERTVSTKNVFTDGQNTEKKSNSSKDSGFVRTNTQQAVLQFRNIPPLPTPKPKTVLQHNTDFSDIVLPPPKDFDN